jgi:quercetin dioxygenase-like cupin family protein
MPPRRCRRWPHVVVVERAGGARVTRWHCAPGWRWSTHVKAQAGTERCTHDHVGYQIAGTMVAEMADGRRLEFRAGDAFCIPPGHGAWVEGGEEVGVHFEGSPCPQAHAGEGDAEIPAAAI